MGHRASCGRRLRSRRSRATPTTSTRSSSTPSTGRRSATRRRLRRRAGRAATTTPRPTPDGVRCTLADYMINVFGPRPPSSWGPLEKKLGHGFAGLPLDDVGVQYGLDGAEGGHDHAGAVRRPQREDRRRRHRHQTAPPQRFAADEPALASAVPQRRDQRDQQPQERRDHRPARPRPGRVPRRLPHVDDPRAARARARATSRTTT